MNTEMFMNPRKKRGENILLKEVILWEITYFLTRVKCNIKCWSPAMRKWRSFFC